MSKAPKIEPSWLEVLRPEFDKIYMKNLRAFLVEEARSGQRVFPPMPEIFNAFWLTPFDKVKVVILGQDPYHGPGQAHGLCFSVRRGQRVPPSLVNIYQELKSDLGISAPNHGELTSWAEQGVLMLNTALTVRARQANSHKDQGWEIFTDKVIEELNASDQEIAFVLWGSKAGKKSSMINRQKHLIVSSSHPSPYSADRGFFGSKPFSRINQWLESKGRAPIDWTLPA